MLSADPYPDTQKCSADPDATVTQPQKKQRVGGASIQPQQAAGKGTRKSKEVRLPHNPPSHKDGDINSDNELIGIFDDDEELEPDENEDDDIDPDITVSIL